MPDESWRLEAERLKAERDQLRDMLQGLQWADAGGISCPVCGSLWLRGHDKDCKLAALLKGG